MKVTAVIGANYGDEGKGQVVDFLCSREKKTIVVRHNGGGQAGHTVEIPSGERHVFRHHGSGTLRGCPTYLSKHFVVNPAIFLKEHEELRKKDLLPEVFVSGDCMVTTPYDVALNQIRELARGNGRHGSCGCGVGETVGRYETSERLARQTYRLKDLVNVGEKDFRDNLFSAFREAERIIKEDSSLKNAAKDGPWSDIFEDFDNTYQVFQKEMHEFSSRVGITEANVLREYNQVVFEGAQGIELCQTRFDSLKNPYVTRSLTGTQNVAKICAEAKIGRFNAMYVTRCYVTRHGAGPLPWELGIRIGDKDETNHTNKWQGGFRYGWLDIDRLAKNIDGDFREGMASRTVAMTHGNVLDNDLSGGRGFYAKGNMLYPVDHGRLVAQLRELTDALLVFYKKTAEDVHQWR